MRYAIEVENLRKTYTYKKWKGLLRRETVKVKALRGVSFKIKPGEIVGYLGRNGSGKSTTIKILTGILYPDKGRADVLGFIPWKDKLEYTKHIGVVFGQKSALWWDLPVMDSIDFWAKVYKIDEKRKRDVLSDYADMMGISKILNQPARKLSFGQRMRVELLISVMHEPEILFLDEPTIGLDVIAREKVREFLTRINKEEKTTIFLTTHELQDVEALCDRVILIDGGKIVFDGKMKTLKRKFGGTKYLEIEFSPKIKENVLKSISKKGVQIIDSEEGLVLAKIPSQIEKEIIGEILEFKEGVISFNLREPNLEEIVRSMYSE